MSITINRNVTINTLSCAGCGMEFGITAAFEARRREDHKNFYCPAGCHNYYPGESEAEKAQKQADLYKQRYERQFAATQAARDQAEATERSNRALRGVVTKTKKRIQSGVCPVEGCKRHFSNLQSHVLAKHPEYKP